MHPATTRLVGNRIHQILSRTKFSASRPVFADHDESKKNGVNSKVTSDANNSDLSKSPNSESTSERFILGSKDNKGKAEGLRPFFVPDQAESSVSSNGDSIVSPEDLEPPTNCCMSGCVNCVWLEYAEKLAKTFSDPKLSRERVKKELDGLEDANIKAFIMMELRSKGLL